MHTQTINRTNLKKLYESVNNCNKWKTIITTLLSDHLFDDEFEVENNLILTAYKEANDSQKKLIKKFFDVVIPKKITDRIKSFDDILDIAGKTLEEIMPYKSPKTKAQKSQNAFAKIQLITEIYNEGWEADFKNSNEYKYYPYFKKAHGGRWVFYDCFGYYCDGADYGFGCYFKSSELATDAANKFIDIYNDYLP